MGTQFLLKHPMIIQFDEEKLMVSFMTDDWNTVKKRETYDLTTMSKFSDFNFDDSLTFKAKFKKGKTFAVYSNSNVKNNELESLITDFKRMLKSKKSRIDTSVEGATPVYQDFYKSNWATYILWGGGALGLALCSILITHMYHNNEIRLRESISLFLVISFFVGYALRYFECRAEDSD